MKEVFLIVNKINNKPKSTLVFISRNPTNINKIFI